MGTPVAQLLRILSASIAPVIVISGIGLLLLSMTNRYSRVIERARELIKDLDATGEEPRRKLLVEQIQIIYRRARILRLAIILSAVSILFVAVTVLSLFTGQVIGAQVDYLSVPCFGVSLLALLGSLYFFIRDVTISLNGAGTGDRTPQDRLLKPRWHRLARSISPNATCMRLPTRYHEAKNTRATFQPEPCGDSLLREPLSHITPRTRINVKSSAWSSPPKSRTVWMTASSASVSACWRRSLSASISRLR